MLRCATIALVTTSLLFVNTITLKAQDAMPQMPQPTKEHQWLKKFVGQWTVKHQGQMGPDQPPMEMQGSIESRDLGGFWVINELKSEMPGMSVTGVQTIGYNRQKKKYVGTWVDSMTDFIWHYEGTVDESGMTLTLEAEGPNMMAAGKTAKFRDIYEFKSDDEIAVYSKMQGDDGNWTTFMSGTAVRKK